MRLTAAKRKEYIRRIKEIQAKKVCTPQDLKERERAFTWLTFDHADKIGAKLQQVCSIGNIPIIDALAGDSIESDNIRFSEYLHRYDDLEIHILEEKIRKAEVALQWLKNELTAEKAEREKKQRGDSNEKVLQFTRRGS